MTERQSKLKSILDRYSACTLSLEDAERELGECLLGNGYTTGPSSREVCEQTTLTGEPYVFVSQQTDNRPVAYVESERSLSPTAVEALTKQWNEVHGGKVRLMVLAGGLHLVNPHGYQPQRIHAKVGAFELECDPSNGFTWEATFDGEAIRPHRKLTLVVEGGRLPVVDIEYVPLITKKDS